MSDSSAERVGRYQLLEPIGVGPSGAVSRAKVFGVAGFERQFAVKRFHADLTASATMAQALSAAARAYGSLEHPRIARMSEFGVAQGQTFTAVEYVAGIDALRLVNEARTAGITLAAGGALAIVSQAARAIGYAHGRGLSHLGLAPTNVIITGDGDVKITDFGILAATLPAQPTNVSRLANRIAYLSPEQLASEATSAATDVFALGVLAYELVTTQRTFRGDTPAQIAQSIMSGPPMEPALPRPIVRVLQRCLARSPFERFPDARALADALDAALRVAPVPGTRKDIGSQVMQILDRLAALNDGAMSGMVALNLGTGPIPRSSLEGPSIEGDPSTTEFVRPDVHVPGPSPLVSPSSTVPDLPRLPLTVPGLAPPPIPVPQGIGSLTPPPVTPIGPPPSTTLLGMQGAKPPPIPSIRAREVGGNVASVPSLTRPRTGGVPILPANTMQGARPGESGRVPAPSPAALSGLATPVVLGPRPSPITDENDLPTARASSLDRDSDLSTREYPEGGLPRRPSEAETLAGEPLDGLLSASRPSEYPTAVRPPIELPPPVPDHRHASEPIRRGGDDWGRIDAGRAEPGRLGAARSDSGRVSTGDASDSGRTTPPPIPVAPASPPITISPPRAQSVPPPPLTPPTSSRAPAAVDALFDPVNQLSVPPPPAVGQPGQPLFNASSYMPEPDGNDAADSDSLVLQLVAEPPTVPGLGPIRPPTQPSGAPSPGSSRPGSQPSRLSEILGAQPAPSSFVEPHLSASPPLPPLPPLPNDPSLKAPTYPPIAPAASSPPASAPTQLGFAPPPTPPRAPSGYPTPLPGEGPSRPMPTVGASMVDAHQKKSRAWLWVVLGVLVVGGGAIAAWQTGMFDDDSGSTGSGTITSGGGEVKPPPADAAMVAKTIDAGSAAAIDAAQTATTPVDATVTADAAEVAASVDAAIPPADAAVVASNVDAGTKPTPDAGTPTPVATSGELVIASNPPGARVFLGGADQGVTPVKVPGTADRHTIALMLSGHELYVAQVDGRGSFTIPLPEITPTSGPAGIKVLKCAKDRYYVFVDGKPTGQMCPTERIGCETGPHTVEVYDVVSETRRKWEIDVKDTRLSYRVRVDN